VQAAAAAPQPVSTTATPSAPATPTQESSNLITIKSPMIGTFYRAAGPEKPLFANVGDEIAPGKVLCIVEAMKLFNEIESEVSGKIVKILVNDAQPVEFDQPLFLVDPS
ncbi:acetyl-CoA carboxylase biotin carboxyl carrier protein, partial [Sphingobacterium deserti]|uniref:acetyl-CoA carboxylase biotin carboxyl carrier protein n=1 Tax=Sphingobacterium deserti TaxID=1229276 RepID=UPI000560BC54